ncbi:hypothetical protein KCP74_10135 [Salmonella enterica subsp. enterica]|nr:hypothetical protein KCP74_10135 [Salmonella enterica subsp. enterica]
MKCTGIIGPAHTGLASQQTAAEQYRHFRQYLFISSLSGYLPDAPMPLF